MVGTPPALFSTFAADEPVPANEPSPAGTGMTPPTITAILPAAPPPVPLVSPNRAGSAPVLPQAVQALAGDDPRRVGPYRLLGRLSGGAMGGHGP
jgi:hypothetical protein